MREFEPSRDFVARVMKEVQAYEGALKMTEPFRPPLFSSRTVRFAFSAGATLLGALNLIRLYFSVFFPVLCR
jgi:hypothetical protein